MWYCFSVNITIGIVGIYFVDITIGITITIIVVVVDIVIGNVVVCIGGIIVEGLVWRGQYIEWI